MKNIHFMCIKVNNFINQIGEKQMKKIINALLRLYMLPALVFSTIMTLCMPSCSNAYGTQDEPEMAYV